MNLKALFTAILVVCSITLANAQSKDILAKSAMLNADEAYANGQYFECIGFLRDAETNLGATNSRIQYLKVKSLLAIGTSDQYNMEIWSQAESELKLFFEITPENGYVPEKYEEMILTLGKLKKYIEEAEVVASIEKLNGLTSNDDNEQKLWIACQDYLNRYPEGAYVTTARKRIAAYNKEMELKQNPDKYLKNLLESGVRDYDLAMRLIKYGADVNAIRVVTWDIDVNGIYFTPLGLGAGIKDTLKRLEYVKLIFEHNADPNTECKGYRCYLPDYVVENYVDPFTPYTTLEILKLFLEKGLNVNYSQGALLNKLVRSHKEIQNGKVVSNYIFIEFLLQNKANPFLKEGYTCKKYTPRLWTSYELAKANGYTDLVELFKKYKK